MGTAKKKVMKSGNTVLIVEDVYKISARDKMIVGEVLNERIYARDLLILSDPHSDKKRYLSMTKVGKSRDSKAMSVGVGKMAYLTVSDMVGIKKGMILSKQATSTRVVDRILRIVFAFLEHRL